MPSDEATLILLKHLPPGDPKTPLIAADIDALRVLDLSQLLKPVAYTYDGLIFEIQNRVDRLKRIEGGK